MLQQYKTRSFVHSINPENFYHIQFRILVNNNFFKNKQNKIFRYYNKTTNTILYKQNLKTLTNKIKSQINEKKTMKT